MTTCPNPRIQEPAYKSKHLGALKYRETEGPIGSTAL